MIAEAFGGEVVRALHSVDDAELGACGFHAVVTWRGAQGAAGFAFFVRVVEDVDVFVAFLVFAGGVFGCHPVAVAFRV